MPFGPEHKSTFGEPTAHDLLCDYVDASMQLREFEVLEEKDKFDAQFDACQTLWALLVEYRRLHG